MRYKLKVLCTLLLVSVALAKATYATWTKAPNLTLFFGSIKSSEDLFGEFVENELETSVFTPIVSYKQATLETGLTFLNAHRDIREYEYNLTQLIVPLRLMYRYPVLNNVTVYAGGQTGVSLLLETYEKTETYWGVGVGGILGAEYKIGPHYRMRVEYANFMVSYKRIDNLNTNLSSLRLGLGYSF